MRLRSFILAGLCAVLTLGAPAYAAAPANTKAAKADIAKTKSAAVELKQLKKKKKPTEADLARIQELEKQVRVERELAKEKVLEARKMAMREAAKAKADAARQEFLTKKGQKPVVQDADAEDAKSAKKLVKLETAKPVQPIPAVVEEPLTPEAQDVVSNGNNGELRSEPRPGETDTRPNNGLFAPPPPPHPPPPPPPPPPPRARVKPLRVPTTACSPVCSAVLPARLRCPCCRRRARSTPRSTAISPRSRSR